jgi:UDP-glucose 4-epimerase
MPIRTIDPLQPASPYGVHKRIAEDLCRSYAQTFGIPVAIVRLFSVYGAGLQKQLLWDACLKLTNGDARFGGTGEEQRDWLHVEDAARLLVEAGAHADADCVVANGGTGDATTVRTVLEMLAGALSIEQPLIFSGDRRGGDPTDYQADCSEARAWGWQAERSLTEGLSEYAEWYLEQSR